jgi:radical SAM superfamily enzyme YgiQ (UPF0313 family)
MCKDAGVRPRVYVMVGLPGQTWDSILKTNEFIKKVRPYMSSVQVLVPFPDTEIYQDMRKKGILKTDDQPWDRFLMFSENGVSSPEMIELSKKVSGLTEREIIDGYNLLTATGFRITTSYNLKSPRYVLRILSRIRSFGDVKKQIRRVIALSKEKGMEVLKK